MIDLSGIVVRYGPRTVLAGVNLSVWTGERVALIGPNGAGKTTLIRALLGLVRFEGSAWIDGLDVRAAGHRARAQIGYVPQIPAFPAALSAAEVVALFQELRGSPVDPLPALQAVGLAAHVGDVVRTLSGGMVRRLALAVAGIGAPPCLLMDEPTGHLDREGEDLVRRWLERAREEGKTVLLATHHLKGLEALVDRLVLLEAGAIVAEARTDPRRPIRVQEPTLEEVLRAGSHA